MPEERLEQVMMDFLAGRYNVLICTTIVEIGLDIPQVNTILIEDAHMMGLSQLYQLRGRVGRADQQAYCYLLYPRKAQLSPEARARLEAMQEFVELGSGFKLAMRDLEIRGAGNLLGPEQHGHLAAVGFELYSRLLDEAVRELRGQPVVEVPEATIDLGVDAYLPDTFIPDEGQRMATYRKLATTRTVVEADTVAQELTDRFGTLPDPVAHLLEIVRLRALAREAGVASIRRERTWAVIKPAAWALAEDVRTQVGGVLGGRLTPASGGWRLPLGGTRFAEDAAVLRQALQALVRLARNREPAATPG
jgi:transcription-repair coupling factor (superfamily II helicase)